MVHLDILKAAHARLVFQRREKVLAAALAERLKGCRNLMDVGSGSGSIARRVADAVDGLNVHGIDVLIRPQTEIPVALFDGETIPADDKSTDVVTFVDVLHHVDDPDQLLSEAARVAKKCVVIKDHLAESAIDHFTLRFMDWVGNAPHGVVLPYNYVPRRTWLDRFDHAGLEVATFDTDIPLYAWPFSLIFGRKLHFIACLTPVSETRNCAQSQS